MKKKILKNSGFTVIELILVIGILGIVAGFGAPLLKDHLTNMKAKAAARDIYSAFQTAKLEAVKENESVAAVFTTGTYSPGGAVGGFQLFVDNGAGAGGTAEDLALNGSESSIITVVMPKKVSLVTAVFTAGNGVNFTGQGLPLNSSSGNVVVRTSNRWYRINLSPAGNINMQKSADGLIWS